MYAIFANTRGYRLSYSSLPSLTPKGIVNSGRNDIQSFKRQNNAKCQKKDDHAYEEDWTFCGGYPSTTFVGSVLFPKATFDQWPIHNIGEKEQTCDQFFNVNVKILTTEFERAARTLKANREKDSMRGLFVLDGNRQERSSPRMHLSHPRQQQLEACVR